MRTTFLPGLGTSPALLLLSISMTNVTAGGDAAFKKTWQQTFMPYIYNKVIQECRKLNSKRFDSYFYIILTTTETTTTTRNNCSHRFHQVTKLQHGQQTIDSCQKHSSAKTNVVPVILFALSIISGAHQFHSVSCDKRSNNISHNVVPVVSVVVKTLSTRLLKACRRQTNPE